MDNNQPENIRSDNQAGRSPSRISRNLEKANEYVERLNQATERTKQANADFKTGYQELAEEIRGLERQPVSTDDLYHGEFRNPDIRREYEDYLDNQSRQNSINH